MTHKQILSRVIAKTPWNLKDRPKFTHMSKWRSSGINQLTLRYKDAADKNGIVEFLKNHSISVKSSPDHFKKQYITLNEYSFESKSTS